MTLDASAVPGANFDLDEWKLQLPVDANGGFVGSYTEIRDLDSYTSEYFYTGPDGAIVLRAPVEGATTSGSSYARTELRELDGVSQTPTNAAWTLEQGGYMTVAMQVDEVPKKLDGTDAKIVIGQIHGGDHQLVRLYYENGSVYWVNGRNEVQSKDAVHQFRDAQGNTPQVSLNETFVYTMDVKGHDLTLTLQVDGKTYTSSITIGPGWDDNQFYFKAGLYLGTNATNSTGDGQVSIFGIDVTHDGTKPVLDPSGLATFHSLTQPTSALATEIITEPPPAIISDNGIAATLQGTSGNDIFLVSQKATTVLAGAGIDSVQSSASWIMSSGVEQLQLTGSSSISGTGRSAKDIIRGNEAANYLKGCDGNDELFGNGGNDTLKGGNGADRIEGGAGSDAVTGDSGADVLNGGAGGDTLAGGAGADVLTGGEGADVFVFRALSHSRGAEVDRISDFASALDHIDLRSIDANTKVSGNQAFVWGGTGIGHLILKDGHLIADVNGDWRADFALDLAGARISSLDVFL